MTNLLLEYKETIPACCVSKLLALKYAEEQEANNVIARDL